MSEILCVVIFSFICTSSFDTKCLHHTMETPSKNMVENLAQLSLDETTKFKFFESSTQVALAQGCHSLLSLPHLSAKRTNGR